MAYNYLLELHKIIEQKIAEARISKTAALGLGETTEVQFHSGRLFALSRLDEFLKNKYHQKLPRKVREAVEKKQGKTLG